MKCLIISLLISAFGYLSLCSQPHNMVAESHDCVCLQKDSVLREHSSQKGFEEIRVIHKNHNDGWYANLKPVQAWEAQEYALRQKEVFRLMRNNILKHIPIQTLNEFLEYKFNPIICKLTIEPHEGVVKKVSFEMNHKVSSFFTDRDIILFENIIVNMRFCPEDSMNGYIKTYYWVINRKQIREYLDPKNNIKLNKR